MAEAPPERTGPSPWAGWAASKNTKAAARNRSRALVAIDAKGTRGVADPDLVPGPQPGARPEPQHDLVLFAGNDYLGLSAHPAVTEAAKAAIDRWGAGAGASRMVTGTRPVHTELEEQLAAWKGTEAAVVFPTGYMANLGVLSALAGPNVLICSDALNHASIIDGCRLATSMGARVGYYRHLDVAAVDALLAEHARLTGPTGRAIVASDSVFSMDGDPAPVEDLAQACARHGALLVLDEAHAVLGPHPGTLPCEVLRVGTLSKTLGSLGGFVAGSAVMTAMLVNRSRPLTYTTALSPADAAAALAAVGVLRSAEGERLVRRLRSNVERFAPGREVVSPIFPVVVGTEQAALGASAALAKSGLLVPAIRPPTVPPGTCRLRVSLSAAHTGEDIDLLSRSLTDLGLNW